MGSARATYVPPMPACRCSYHGPRAGFATCLRGALEERNDGISFSRNSQRLIQSPPAPRKATRPQLASSRLLTDPPQRHVFTRQHCEVQLAQRFACLEEPFPQGPRPLRRPLVERRLGLVGRARLRLRRANAPPEVLQIPLKPAHVRPYTEQCRGYYIDIHVAHRVKDYQP